MPVFTGQFNGRRNTKTLSLTRFSHVFFYFPSSQPVSSWSHEINADPAVLDQSVCVCDTQMLALRQCDCVCVRVCVFWSKWAHNRALACLIPLAIQIHRLFSEAKNSVRRLPLTLPLKWRGSPSILTLQIWFAATSTCPCRHIDTDTDVQEKMRSQLNKSCRWKTNKCQIRSACRELFLASVGHVPTTHKTKASDLTSSLSVEIYLIKTSLLRAFSKLCAHTDTNNNTCTQQQSTQPLWCHESSWRDPGSN